MGYMARGVGNIDVGGACCNKQSKFPTYSPGGATPFDFVVVYNNIKVRTGDDVCSL